MNVTLRGARPDDREAVSALHVSSWLNAYRGMLPDGYLDGPLRPELEAYWRQALPRAGEMDKPIGGHPVVQAEYVWSSLSGLADTQRRPTA